MNKALLAPLSFLYGMGVALRNKMFDWGLLSSREYDIPIICVGNITVGGTGKTPVVEMLVSHFSSSYKIAVLSRGYGRKSKGYLEVETSTSFLQSGDEPRQIKLKYPEIVVAVCEKRTIGIENIRKNHPGVNLIIMDDGFQHRYVEPWVNIVLMDYTRPVYRDHLLPWGSLRDVPSQLHRANYFLVTKCPEDITPLEKRLVRKSLGLYPYQQLYFCRTEPLGLRPLFDQEENMSPVRGVIAMSGIGNPTSFHKTLATKWNLVSSIIYPDHHPYRRRDLKTMSESLENAPEGTVIVTTEKDAVKLSGSKKISEDLRRRLYYQPVRVRFSEDSEKDFIKRLNYDVRTNPKHSLLHS